MNGYHNRIAWIDLSRREVKIKPLDEKDAVDFVVVPPWAQFTCPDSRKARPIRWGRRILSYIWLAHLWLPGFRRRLGMM